MTDYIIPGLLLALSALALGQRKNYYDWLLEGAAQGLGLIKTILPSLVLLLTAVHMFRASGASGLLSHLLSPVFSRFGIPPECAGLVLIRPISGSAALAQIFAEFTLTAGAVKSMTAAFPETICRTASRSSETVQPAGAPAG